MKYAGYTEKVSLMHRRTEHPLTKGSVNKSLKWTKVD